MKWTFITVLFIIIYIFVKNTEYTIVTRNVYENMISCLYITLIPKQNAISLIMYAVLAIRCHEYVVALLMFHNISNQTNIIIDAIFPKAFEVFKEKSIKYGCVKLSGKIKKKV